MQPSSIGGLKIVEIGASEICHSPVGQSTIYFRVMDSSNNHYIFVGDVGNAGYAFNIFPLNDNSEKTNIKDLQWCRKWSREHCRNLSIADLRKTILVVDKTDFNRVFSMLGYNGNDGESICSECGKKVSDWWFATNYLCSDCVKKENEFRFMY